MGMFSRMSDIVQANINAMLDKAEDPAKVIKLIIQEMEETLVEVRSVAARNLADQKHLNRKISQLETEAQNWHYKAQLAVEKGKDHLARAALQEKQAVLTKAAALQSELKVIDEALQKLQDDTSRLQAKLNEARNKQKSLNVRKQSATVRLKVKAQGQVARIDDAITKFEQFERKIDDLESQVEAYELVDGNPSLQQQFDQLEADESIEQELQAMKKKVA